MYVHICCEIPLLHELITSRHTARYKFSLPLYPEVTGHVLTERIVRDLEDFLFFFATAFYFAIPVSF